MLRRPYCRHAAPPKPAPTHFPCCCCAVPRYRDDDVDLVQSHTILRYLGRKHGLYGATPEEAARIDMLLDGMGDLKGKIVPLVYMDSLKNDAQAKKANWDTHLDPATATGPCRGAHMVFINNLVKKHGKGFAVGDQLSIADVFLFDLVELHLGMYGEEFSKAYPDLLALKEKIGAVPSIAAYLQSPLRFPF